MNECAGFVGCGVMGLPMARNLSRAVPVMAFDVREQRRKLAATALDAQDAEKNAGSIKAAGSLHDVTAACRTVFLSLPSSEIVKTVTVGPDGLADTLPSGAVVVDTSTTEPGVSREVAARLQERNIDFLDAPVSGGERAAIEGTLSFMVGGNESTFSRVLPLLEAMGGSVVRVGPVGAGEVAKLVNNLIVGITFAAVAEGFSLGAKSGINPAELYKAIRGGWAGSQVLEVAAPAMLERDFAPGGTVDIHWKDLGYALSLAKEQDVPTPMTALAHEVFKAARAAGDGGKSQPVVVKLWEQLLGIEVSPGTERT